MNSKINSHQKSPLQERIFAGLLCYFIIGIITLFIFFFISHKTYLIFIAVGLLFFGFIIFIAIRSYLKIKRKIDEYPYLKIDIDISGKRNIDIWDYVDRYLLDYDLTEVKENIQEVNNWKKTNFEYLENTKKFQNLKKEIFEEEIDDENMIQFRLIKYHNAQSEYVPSSEIYGIYSFSPEEIFERYDLLVKNGLECELSKLNAKDQRKLMTKELRQQIMIRDNYTCQCCGKYMSDEVGLHIDHIVPVSKGGKTVPSNLQVLCSKCNGKKGNKTNVF